MGMLTQLGGGVAVPVLWSASLLWLAGRRKRFDEGAAGTPLLPGIAIAGGFAATHVWISGWAGLLPRQPVDWLIVAGLAAAVLARFDLASIEPRRRRAAAALAALAALGLVALVWSLTRPLIRYTWSDLAAPMWFAGLCVVGVLFSLLLRRVERVLPARASAAQHAVTSAGLGMALALSGSLKLGQLGGGLAAAAAVLWLGALVGRGWLRWGPVAPVVAVLQFGLIAIGCLYSGLPALAGIAFLAAPACGLVVRRASVRLERYAGGLAVCAASVCAGLGLALTL